MAQTQRGRSLTAAFQRSNRVLADKAGRGLRDTWDLLNPHDVWGAADDWLYELVPGVQAAYSQSQRLAEPYLREFSKVEGFVIPENLPKEPLDVGAFKRDLRYRGPRVMVDKIKSGMPPVLAKNSTLQRLQDTVSMWVQDGGRGVIIGASSYSGERGRWRRVASGVEPCAFCAMLAGRGPVYTKETVDFESHPACNCSVEIVPGDWEPDQLEHLWRQSYDEAGRRVDASGGLRTRDNILHWMRRDTPELFSDGVYDPER